MTIIINFVKGEIAYMPTVDDYSSKDFMLSKIKTPYGFHFNHRLSISTLFQTALGRPMPSKRRSSTSTYNIVLGKRGRWYNELTSGDARLMIPDDVNVIGVSTAKEHTLLSSLRLNNYDTHKALISSHRYMPMLNPDLWHYYKVAELVEMLNADDSVVEWIPHMD